MESKIGNQNIDRLDISCKSLEILKSNKITKISQLAKKTRTNLKEIGLSNEEVNKADIELQLLGLSLKNSL